MNAETTETTVEIEFLNDLKKQCQFARRSKARPELAIPAAKWEMKINTALDELHRLETPPLPLGKQQHAVAA
jgi:hypothetical protein